MNALAEKLKSALKMWITLSGVDPSAKSFRMRLGGGMDEYTVSEMHKEIQRALTLDKTNVTGYLMLDALSTRYFKERSFSVEEILTDPQKTARYVAEANKFRELVRSSEIQDIGADFVLSMRQALRHYRADSEEVMTVVNDHHQMAFLRRDAFLSMEMLRVDQFLVGEPEKAEVKPAYHNTVHRFWNINSLISAACKMPSGVTLNLIRDPDEFQSYFAFAIRNGGNLFVLSDVPEGEHPLQRYMTRRPDRALATRAGQNWFPYDLLNIKYDEEEGRLYIDRAGQTGMIPLQQTADRMKTLSELEPAEAIWLVMMFDLIVERFWHQQYQAPRLSYTAQMIREETPLSDAAAKANLPITKYRPLALKPLSVADVLKDAVGDKSVGNIKGVNTWMEERYASKVSDELVNLLACPNSTHYLLPVQTKDGRNGRYHQNHETAIVSAGQVVSVLRSEDEHLARWNREGRYNLHALDPTSFGTKQEIENDRLFIARHNLAKGVQRLADEEFEARKGEVMKWWREAVTRNISEMYRIAVVPEVWRSFDKERFPFAEIMNVLADYKAGRFRFARRYTEEDWKNNSAAFSTENLVLSQGFAQERGFHYKCHVTGNRASIRVLMDPKTADDLAYMAGCAVDELPDVLQHWAAKTSHHGNHLLKRLDPMDWALHNPWSGKQFRVLLMLSVRGLKQLEKNYSPPDNYKRPEGSKPEFWASITI